MTKILTAENAQITTATIAVKTITVERRQITLSIFRQIIEEDIVDREVLRLCGVGRGHCRYLIEDTPDRAIHLVWRKGGELRRCVVKRYEDRWTSRFNSEMQFIRNTCVSTFPPTHYGWWEWHRTPAFAKASGGYEMQRVLMDTREEVIEQLQQEYDDRCAWCDQYEALVAPLFELPQLFIAA